MTERRRAERRRAEIDWKFYKKVFWLALPIALQSLITIGVNMLDTIMVGNLGEMSLSAVSLANQFIGVYQIFCMGLGMGASVLVSRYWGMQEAEPVKSIQALRKTICIVVRITVSLALLFAVVTLLIPQVVMRMYTQDAEIIRLGEIYFRFSVITYFFLGLSLVCTIILRCVGQVKLPLLVSIGAFFVNLLASKKSRLPVHQAVALDTLNLLANYVFIFGKLGMPRMGIAGAALGTLIARLFEAGMICGYLLLKDEKIGFRVKHLGMKTADLLGEYIRISIPVLISDGILAIGNNTVAMVIGRLGVTFVAANAITSVTQQLSTVMIQGVCQAGAIVTGQTLGEGKQEQAQSQAYRFLGLGLGLGMLSAFFIMAVSPAIIGSYKVSEETAEVAAQLMHAISLILIFQATNSIMTKGVLRGGGDTKMLMLADNLFLWVVSIPLGMLAGFVFHFPAFWIYVCLKADQILKAVWCVFRLRSGKWMKKITVGKVSGQEDRA